MYSNASAVSRPEISAFLEQAADVDKLMIAQKVLPVYSSDARAGRYPKLLIANGQLLKAGGDARGASGSYSEVDRKWDWDTYDCVDRGLEERIDDALSEEMKNFFDLETTTAKLIRRAVALSYEIRVANLVTSSGNSGFNSTAATVAYTQANLATIDFARDVTNAIARMEANGQQPNTLVLQRDVFNLIRRSSKLQSWVFGNSLANSGNADITEKLLADRFGLEQVLVSGAKYDAATKGQAPNLTPIWPTSSVVLGNVKGGDFNAGGFGRTIVWGADSPGGLYTSETYRCEVRRGDIVRVRCNNAEKIIDPTCAELIATSFA